MINVTDPRRCRICWADVEDFPRTVFFCSDECRDADRERVRLAHVRDFPKWQDHLDLSMMEYFPQPDGDLVVLYRSELLVQRYRYQHGELPHEMQSEEESAFRSLLMSHGGEWMRSGRWDTGYLVPAARVAAFRAHVQQLAEDTDRE